MSLNRYLGTVCGGQTSKRSVSRHWEGDMGGIWGRVCRLLGAVSLTWVFILSGGGRSQIPEGVGPQETLGAGCRVRATKAKGSRARLEKWWGQINARMGRRYSQGEEGAK